VNQADFVSFVAAAARRAVGHTVGRLVLTRTRKGEPVLREPEMRHALAQEAEARHEPLHYGIEVPTKEVYRFTLEPGDGEVSARHDFVVLAEARHDAARMNLVELKREQPEVTRGAAGTDCPKIRKDLQKLLLEPALDGKCMLHLFHAAKSGTIPSVLTKYNAAMPQAIRRAREAIRRAREATTRDPLPDLAADRSWFSLFILVVRQRGDGNRPALYHHGVTSFGAWLTRIEAGEVGFSRELLQEVDLPV
jgi:hypothetical protein